MQPALDELKRRLALVADLHGVAALLGWDQATYMPPGGVEDRARQMATVTRLAHEAFVDPAIGRLLDQLEAAVGDLDPDGFEARLVAVTRYDYDRATRVPAEFLAELEAHSSRGYQLWAQARRDDDYGLVADHIRRTVELSRRVADFFPGHQHPADPLIDQSDRGMTVARLRPLFAELRARLVPLVEAVIGAAEEADSPLRQHYPESEQIAFGEEVVRAFGFDFRRGRQDKSDHPFATALGHGDVRVTTRVDERDLSESLYSTLHEAGHAMYEQDIAPELRGTPLGGGASSGVHESQSRLWENVVGRSREFWRHYFPRLQRRFPAQLAGADADRMYRAANRVSRSLIRTDADELTYNLHVMIRFDLECALLDGSLTVEQLPDAWRERYRDDLGIEPRGHRDGVLQDMHWYAGLVGGAFQGYTLGNVISAQLFDAAVKACPRITEDIAAGRFDGLHDWLRENVSRHGRKFEPDELVRRATGSVMTITPYLTYLEAKYGELYGLRQ